MLNALLGFSGSFPLTNQNPYEIQVALIYGQHLLLFIHFIVHKTNLSIKKNTILGYNWMMCLLIT